ncbi:cytochrome c family protein [Neorhizobium sp. NCHU2750]|uniref:c-type cytochrome n=1 Tax=Neorhizobium sp. NCHU2750 TaxID=1825976 RepID=UPI000E747427|nr:cytochrome c [Neorhizobium sp. NCHU2750]
MNPYINMSVGALLATIFVMMTVSIASEGIFHSSAPVTPGFAIAAAEEPAAGAGGGEAAPASVPVGQLLANADAGAGATIFKKCQSCHSAEKGGPNKVGPDLWGVVGRPVATHEGFSYSAGMKDFSNGGQETWTFDHLNHFLTAPKAFVKGTAMGFAGLKNDKERANLLAYLREQSDNPLPLPDANAPAPATN